MASRRLNPGPLALTYTLVMDARSIKFITTACGGELLKGASQTQILRVCTDSRQLQPGDLFVAIAGEKFNGHDFVTEAARTAAAVMVERNRAKITSGKCAVIAVKDTRTALGRLAAEYRRGFALRAVAVAGSNGKTTTKELMASVLRQKLTALWSEASFNNDIGVPLTLLRLEQKHRVAVVEAGTNHPGELEPLVRMIQPQFGVITCIGREHMEFFDDLEGVAREEGWVAELLPVHGKLFINGDDPWSRRAAERCHAPVVRVGLQPGNDWQARNLRLDKHGVTFRAEGPEDVSAEYRINLLGRHQAVNALFAIAMGVELGLSQAQIERGLAECQPSRMRLQLCELHGVRVLDDAYNANADSMAAALQTLHELPCKGRKLAVLGDMAELGAHSAAAHEEVGRRAGELGIGQLFAVGKMAPQMARGARAAGLNRVLEFADVEAAAVAVKQFVKQGDVLLLKASRATRLERVLDLLRAGDAVRKN
jgi:UDP-N-acetylmuramoyl-tripeptide--D-alanyl-D-alanine ligase